MKRLRVLISAHEFSPEQGSECAVGWNIVTRLAAFHDVTVLCADGAPLWRNSYRNAVERYVARHGEIPGLRVVFVDQPPATWRYARINRELLKLTRGIGWQPLYYLGLDAWHAAAFRKAVELGVNCFDVVHQLTPISFLRPGYLWQLDKPFFWGPLGGMFKVPAPFSRSGGIKPYLFERLRSFNIERQIRKKRLRQIVRKARRIWTVTHDECRIVNGIDGEKAALMIETGSPKEITGQVRHYAGKAPLRLCWSGGHVPGKALPLLLYALSSLPERDQVVLDILGQGPQTEAWKTLSARLGLSRIHWHGRLPYSAALNTMGQADVFVHTSYREGTPHVVLEALGWGMPVICHDACGMGVAVNSTCGIKVPFMYPEESIKGFRNAIQWILHHPELVERLSKGALRRARELSWDAKAREIADTYTQLG